jgi:hypothetical protein
MGGMLLSVFGHEHDNLIAVNMVKKTWPCHPNTNSKLDTAGTKQPPGGTAKRVRELGGEESRVIQMKICVHFGHIFFTKILHSLIGGNMERTQLVLRRCTLSVWIIATLAAAGFGQQPIALIDGNKEKGGWEFGNGPEYPGARGTLELAAETYRDKPVLNLYGDFSQGGNYVQAAFNLPEIPIDTLSFWVHAPTGVKQLTIRLVDGSEQCHQVRLKINEKGGWQQIVMPVEKFFKTMGTPSALDIATQYEKWGGANDGKWQQPGRLLVFLCGRTIGTKATVRISDVLLRPSADKKTSVKKEIRLDEMLQTGQIDWGFNLGQEFAGAKGGLDLLRDQPQAQKFSMRLHADFTGGGAYVGIRKSFAPLDVQAMQVIRLKMRSQTTKSYGLRLVDGTGQCHQRKGIPFNADGNWHDVEIVPTRIAGSEHWGGSNDGKWYDSVQLIELMLNTNSHDGKKPDLIITDIRADVLVEAKLKPSAFTERFESESPLAAWQNTGVVRIDSPGHAESEKALLLNRSLEQLQNETGTTSPPFNVNPGSWQVRYAWKAKLHSPDNSYHGSIALNVLDRTGRLLETIPVGIGYGSEDWQQSSKTIVLPRAASQARFRIQLKKTYGSFWLDELSAAPLSIQPIEQRIERILLATDAVGNLLLPGDKIAFKVTVEANKPLPSEHQDVRYSVRDYWGAEQLTPGQVTLQTAPRKENRFIYSTQINLPSDRLAVGKYYELHVEIPQEEGEPVQEYSGLAVLPPALTKKYAPEQIPFTIRNWDSRISIYFDLADRIGLRLMGVWGGWSSKAPYQPHCPGIERCQELNARWITGTQAANIERDGFSEYSVESLRQGMKNFLQKYANRGLAMIALGNEPHGTGDKVRDNVRAYRAIYETVKAFDPTIHVIGTSVEPNEEYFQAGYQKYLDSYDFHIYEHYNDIRRTYRRYRELMQKYNAVKPIHSTELGLNSQGQTRHAVALEMIKKFTVFFAEGGATVSWFTIQYPDPQGKARGQFGDSHCVFDCKYNLYNPRLDAITYYNMVNGICDKKFIEEKHYPDGIQAYLFRDQQGNCLQVLWLDNDRKDVLLPIPARQNVELVRVDGSRTTLQSTTGGISLSISPEPVLLLYRDKTVGLAKSLGISTLRPEFPPAAITCPGSSIFTLQGPNLTVQSLQMSCPPRWKIALKQAGENQVDCTIQAPPTTTAREVRIYVKRITAGKVIGELAIPLRIAEAGS